MKKHALVLILVMFISVCYASGLTQAMPLPAGQNTFDMYSWLASPEKNSEPSQAKPIGVGPVATDGDTLSMTIQLDQLSSPADIYLGIYSAAIHPSEIFLFTKAGSLVALSSSGLVPWKTSYTGDLDAQPFPDTPVSAIPIGVYYVYLMVTPAGNLSDYYLWSTVFVVFKGGYMELGEPKITIPETGSILMTVEEESGIGSVTYYGTEIGGEPSFPLTKFIVSTPEGQYTVSLDAQERLSEISIGTLQFLFSYNADGTFNYELRDNGSLIFSGSNIPSDQGSSLSTTSFSNFDNDSGRASRKMYNSQAIRMTKRKYNENDFQTLRSASLMCVIRECSMIRFEGVFEGVFEDFVDYLVEDQYLMSYIDLLAVIGILVERFQDPELEDMAVLRYRIMLYLIKVVNVAKDIIYQKWDGFLPPAYDITGDTWKLRTYNSNGLTWQVWNKVSFRGTAAAGSVHPANNDKIVGTYSVRGKAVDFRWSWTTGSGATETQSYPGALTEENSMNGSYTLSTSDGYSEKGTWWAERNTN